MGTAEAPVCDVFNSHLRRNFSFILEEVGEMEFRGATERCIE